VNKPGKMLEKPVGEMGSC